jgi:hypothetical protein
VYSIKMEQTFTTWCQTPKKDCNLSNNNQWKPVLCQYWWGCVIRQEIQ